VKQQRMLFSDPSATAISVLPGVNTTPAVGGQSSSSGLSIPPPPPQAPAVPTGYVSREEHERLLNEAREKVRTEEKDKLYPEVGRQRSEIDKLMADLQAREEAAKAEQKRLDEERKAAQEAEMTATQRLEAFKAEHDATIAQLRAEQERIELLHQKEMELQALTAHRQRRIAEESEHIFPELLELVRGNTPEEIEVSIEDLKQRTAQVVANMQQVAGAVRPRPSMPISGTPPVDMAAAVAAANQGGQELSLQDLAAMPMSEYAQHRDAILKAERERRVRLGSIYG
jgi:hypothetical protein